MRYNTKFEHLSGQTSKTAAARQLV